MLEKTIQKCWGPFLIYGKFTDGPPFWHVVTSVKWILYAIHSFLFKTRKKPLQTHSLFLNWVAASPPGRQSGNQTVLCEQRSSLSADFEKSSEKHENQHKDAGRRQEEWPHSSPSLFFLFFKWVAARKKIVFFVEWFSIFNNTVLLRQPAPLPFFS